MTKTQAQPVMAQSNLIWETLRSEVGSVLTVKQIKQAVFLKCKQNVSLGAVSGYIHREVNGGRAETVREKGVPFAYKILSVRAPTSLRTYTTKGGVKGRKLTRKQSKLKNPYYTSTSQIYSNMMQVTTPKTVTFSTDPKSLNPVEWLAGIRLLIDCAQQSVGCHTDLTTVPTDALMTELNRRIQANGR